jgi:hypothetical protein
MQQINTQTILTVKDGIAAVEKMCWQCGEFKVFEVPLDDVDGKDGMKDERFEGRMCDECCIKLGLSPE